MVKPSSMRPATNAAGTSTASMPARPKASTFPSPTGANGADASAFPTIATPTLILMRHGETSLGRKKMLEAPDTPLDEQGQREVIASAQKLARVPIGPIYSATLARSGQSGDLVSRVTGAPVVPLPSLNALKTGMYDGAPESIANPDLEYYKRNPDHPIPGGESYRAFLTRSLTALHALMGEARMFPNRATVAVTHSSVLSAVSAWLKAGGRGYGVDWNDILRTHGNPDVKPAGAMRLEFDGNQWKSR